MSPSFTANSLIEIGTSDDNNEEVQIVKDVAGSIFNGKVQNRPISCLELIIRNISWFRHSTFCPSPSLQLQR